MARRLWALFVRDWRLIVRNYYLAIVVGLAAFYVLATHFLIPADLNPEPVVVLWDTTPAAAMRALYEAGGGERVVVVESEAEFRRELEPTGRVGLKVSGAALPERIEVTYQGWETERTRRLLEASLQGQVAALGGRLGTSHPSFETVSLRPAKAAPQPPFNLALIPIFVFSEAALMGLFLAGAMWFAEREERALSAYRVTPAGTVEYLLARSAAMGLLGLGFTVLLSLPTTGPGGDWPVILGVVLLGAVVFTLFAVAYATLFRNLGQFLPGAVVLMFVLILPAASYFSPAFSPPLLRLLPSYPLIFALRETYFPTGSPEVVAAAVRQLLLSLAVFFPLALWAVGRQLRGGEV